MKLIIIRRGSATDIYLEIGHGRMINNYYTLRIYNDLQAHATQY
jgi:hypothetical protein